MLMQQTLEKLSTMRLPGMVQAVEEQNQRSDVASLSFDDRLGLMVDREWLRREDQRVTQRLKRARLKQSACMEDIDYRHPRGLNRGVLDELSSCRWIRARRNVIITGATGLGKTWIACAIADRVCREGFTCVYKRVPRLTEELALARADGTYLKLLGQIARTDLLVLDDWALAPIDGQLQHDFLELIDDRAGSRSTLITSQLPVSKWHDMVGDPSVADALLDRILQASTQIALKGESKRKAAPDKE